MPGRNLPDERKRFQMRGQATRETFGNFPSKGKAKPSKSDIINEYKIEKLGIGLERDRNRANMEDDD